LASVFRAEDIGTRKRNDQNRMFGAICDRYDLMNTLMTFGRDRFWRRYLVRSSALPQWGRLLDVGTGTGHIAFEAMRTRPAISAIAVDRNPRMIAVGRTHRGAERVRWCLADALDLPFPNATFDAVVSGYLVRNVIEIRRAFEEQMRVVKPGGRVVCLETSPPPRNILQPFVLIWIEMVIPLLGYFLTGDRAAYRYLAASTQQFMAPREVASVMRGVGMREVTCRRFMLGTQVICVGTRPREQ
jgi:demethylmenaquinone methyltransferase/2-methoxy-6-polyprenyl-1,4-benzoquinol methylase